MARARKINTNLQSNLKKEEIYNFIKSDTAFANEVKKIKQILRNKFCLTQEEVEGQILKICQGKNKQMAFELFELIKEFERNDILINRTDENAIIERHNFGAQIIEDALELFKSETASISKDFVYAMKKARKYNVDPFKFACKTNMKDITIEKFDNALNALTKVKLKELGNKSLIGESEVKNILEQCTTLAVRLKEETLVEIVEFLSMFVTDENTNEVYADVEKMIKNCPSILTGGVDSLVNTMALIEDKIIGQKRMTRAEVVARIALSPSILNTSSKTVIEYKDSLSKEIEKLMSKSKAYKFNNKNQAEIMASEVVFNLDNFTQISSKESTKNFSRNSAILEKYLGTDNAIICMKNLSIINREPVVLELVLAIISSEENNKQLRQDFIKSPTKYFEQLDKSTFKNFNSEHERLRKAKKEIEFQSLPDITVSQNEILQLSKKLSERKSKDILLNIQEVVEQVKLKEAEEKERIKREKREARKAKEQAQKEKAKQRYAVNVAKVVPLIENTSIQPEIKEKSPKEKMEACFGGSLERLKNFQGQLKAFENLPELVDLLYRPLYDSLKKGKLSENLISPSEMSKKAQILKIYSKTQEQVLKKVLFAGEVLNTIIDNSTDINNLLSGVVENKLRLTRKEDIKLFDNKQSFTVFEFLNNFLPRIVQAQNEIFMNLKSLKMVNEENINTNILIAEVKNNINWNFVEALKLIKENISNEKVNTFTQKMERELDFFLKITSSSETINELFDFTLVLHSYLQPTLLYILVKAHKDGIFKVNDETEAMYHSLTSKKLPQFDLSIDFMEMGYNVANRHLCLRQLELIMLGMGEAKEYQHGMKIYENNVLLYTGNKSHEQENKFYLGKYVLNEENSRLLTPAFKKYFGVSTIGTFPEIENPEVEFDIFNLMITPNNFEKADI